MRHGQRTPTSEYTFPTDEPGIGANFHMDQGELTNVRNLFLYFLSQNIIFFFLNSKRAKKFKKCSWY